MPFGDTQLDNILNDLFRTDVVPPATVYVELNRVLPAQAGTGGTIITGTGYAAQPITRGTGAWSAPGAGSGSRRQITNTAAVNFGTAGSDWAPAGQEVVGFTVWNHATTRTGANYMGKGTFAAPLVIQSGNPVQFNAGALAITAAPGT